MKRLSGAAGKVGEITENAAQTRLEEIRRQIRLGQLDMIGAKIPALSEFSSEYHVKGTIAKDHGKEMSFHLPT
jgi:hypothetical protein